MSKIKQVLNSLKPEDLKAVMYAFNNEESFLLKLEDGHYLGVNIYPKGVITKEGVWVYGKL